MSKQHMKSSRNRANRLLHLIVRYIYTLCYCVLLPLIVFAYRKKLKTDGSITNRSFMERFGILPKRLLPNGIVIHCVSVGEVNAAMALVKKLQCLYPNMVITMTTSSTTGASLAMKAFGDSVQHVYLPFDIPFCVAAFLNRLKPKIVLITEVEVWPNLVSKCFKREIPLVLINARMSTKSLKNYRKLKYLFRPTFRQFSHICPQSSESFNNFVEFGVFKTQLTLTNNLKFDLTLDKSDITQGHLLLQQLELIDKPIFLAASTHEPEEKMVLDIYKSLKTQINDLILIIVPRHPQRFETVYQLIKATGLAVKKFSSLQSSQTSVVRSGKLECLLVDVMGKLKVCYSTCNVAFVGGSFATKGGHNALEAALFGKPVVMGPSIYNNPDICNMLRDKSALHIATSKDEVLLITQQWLTDRTLAANLGENGKNVIADNAGAVDKTVNVINGFLE